MSLLLTKTSGDALLATIQKVHPAAFAGAVMCYLGAAVLSCIRWSILIPHHVGLRRLFSLYMVGSFFNTYLPKAFTFGSKAYNLITLAIVYLSYS